MDCACKGVLQEASPPDRSWRSATVFYSCAKENYSSVLGIWVMVDKWKETELMLWNIFIRYLYALNLAFQISEYFSHGLAGVSGEIIPQVELE